MSEPSDFAVVEVPARIADLAFQIAVPRDWKLIDLPPEDVDFSSPGAFFPLLLTAAPWAAVVLTVAARPGFEDGTLQDWSLFLLDSQEIRPTAFGVAEIGNLRGLAGVGRQQQEDTWLEVRFAFAEDGGRLVHLGLLAPEAISASLEEVWQTALRSFALARPNGQNVPLGPGMGISSDSNDASPTEAASAEPVLPTVEVAVPQTEPDSPFSDSEFGFYAKSGDPGTLNPEHPVNVRLREQGVGLVPNLLQVDSDAKTARLAAGAIRAKIEVAFGWHVIDDGRHTLVLDPEGKIQISLGVMQKDGRSVDGILADIQAEAMESYPNPEFMQLEDGGIQALAIRNIVVDDEPVEQVHMLTAWDDHDKAVLRARVTSDPGSMRNAANYADLIMKSAQCGRQPDVSQQELPAWVDRSRQLEREDRLEEAEQLIRESIPSLHFAIEIADLYRRRWIRLVEEGRDPAAAEQARKQAANWAFTYASYATSGGEGVALSMERDEFLRTLGPEPL